ncbi:MAG: purine-nucleoside phosphorylase [Candidatus Omnitrophica bacterium]|nr:purine-nucleoside phosphorylase [Candidatus Omnitrophota bacterium]
MEGIRESAVNAVKFISSKCAMKPKIGVILGTGLGDLSKKAQNKVEIAYKDIPGFPVSGTQKGHSGTLSFGTVGGKDVVFMEGRFHYYEGYPLNEVTFPVRVMKELGVETLFVTNAAGGMNPGYDKGDIVAITDHINFMGVNPLIGRNDNKLGLRFPDMIEPYSNELITLAEKCAQENGIKLQKGVYIGVTGPCLETRAEYRFMHQIGADVVGMSTVPEVIVAVHAGIKVFGLSCVTDRCIPDELEPVNIEEIIATAQKAGPVMDRLIELMITNM